MLRLSRMTKARFLSQKGLTLIELMVALVLTAIVGAALYQGLVSQSRNFVLQDQLAEATQGGRIAMDSILKDLRSAGYGMGYISSDGSEAQVNDQGIVTGDHTLANSVVIATNNDPNRNGTDALFIRRGDSKPYTILHFQPHPQHSLRWMAFIDLNPDDVYIPIKANDFVIFMDPDRHHYRTMKVMERGKALSTDPVPAMPPKYKLQCQDYTGAIHSPTGICLDGSDSCHGTGYRDYGAGTMTKLMEVGYYIDQVRDPTLGVDIPCLMRSVNDETPQIMARGVEDLQVAYQDRNGTWYRGGTGSTASNPPTPGDIRNLRINLLGRARLPSERGVYFQAALEDGSRHPTTGSDGYARRVLTTQIKIRNYGIEENP